MQAQKQQSATEFLTTYGLAILILAVALAMLLAFVGIPSHALPSSCSIYGTFGCRDVAYGSNVPGTSTLVILASLKVQGTVNISSFNAVVGGVSSTSGYCSTTGAYGGPSSVSEGQAVFCIATFPSNTTGQAYTGTFNIKGSYCTVGASKCSTLSSPYSFSGYFRTQGQPNMVISLAGASTTTTIIQCQGWVCQLLAGTGITLNPSNGIGVVTINSNNQQTQLIAGNGITLSPSNGIGLVTVSANIPATGYINWNSVWVSSPGQSLNYQSVNAYCNPGDVEINGGELTTGGVQQNGNGPAPLTITPSAGHTSGTVANVPNYWNCNGYAGWNGFIYPAGYLICYVYCV